MVLGGKEIWLRSNSKFTLAELAVIKKALLELNKKYNIFLELPMSLDSNEV